MPRKPRNPNTQTPEDRALWYKIKRQLRAKLRRKRKKFHLSSNREAALYLTPKPKHQLTHGKIIPFPPSAHVVSKPPHDINDRARGT